MIWASRAGWAHVSCIAAYAKRKDEDLDLEEFIDEDIKSVWSTCQNCNQHHVGEVRLELARERLKDVECFDEANLRRIAAQLNLGLALKKTGAFGESIRIHEGLLDTLHSNQGQIEHRVSAAAQFTVLARISSAYFSLGDKEKALEYAEKRRDLDRSSGLSMSSGLDEAIEMMKIDDYGDSRLLSFATKVYNTHVELHGRDHADAIAAAAALAAMLLKHGKYDESVALHRDVYERSKRVLGEDHPDTKDRKEKFFMVNGVHGPRKAKLVVENPELNGKEVTILRETKDGKKYIVDVGEEGLPQKVKVSPSQLELAQGTVISMQLDGDGPHFNAWVDSFDKETDSYRVMIIYQGNEGSGYYVVTRKDVAVAFF